MMIPLHFSTLAPGLDLVSSPEDMIALRVILNTRADLTSEISQLPIFHFEPKLSLNPNQVDI